MTIKEGLAQFLAFVAVYIGGNVVWDAISGKQPDLSTGFLVRALIIGAAYILVIYFLRKKPS